MTDTQAPELRHLVVRASAGAGKTYQLTNRYLRLLCMGEPMQNVLATTFTRKAAGEVLERVLGRLAKACVDDKERAALSAALEGRSITQSDASRMLRTLIDGLNRLSVSTIDGFFNRAARAMSLELGLPSDPRLIDEGSPLATQMRTDAIHAVLGEQAAGDDGMTTLIDMLRRLHHDNAQRSVTQAIDDIVIQLNEVYRAYPDRDLWAQLPTTGRLSPDLLTTALHAMDDAAQHVPKTKAGAPNKKFAEAYADLIARADQGRWEDVIHHGLVQKIRKEEEKYYGALIPDEIHKAVFPMLTHAKAMRIKALADQTLATYDLLALFDRHYTAARYGQGVLLFSDLTHVLAEGLPNMDGAGIEELCFRLDARVTHLLLDEFQDTSLRQYQVLQPFAEQIVAGGDVQRSLFCVGDTKQAIYGWRGGCAELFEEVEALPGVESTTLSKSWRSSQVVLDAVNQVFDGLSSNDALKDCEQAAAHWQQGFERHTAQYANLPGHVVLHTTRPAAPSDDRDDSIDAEDEDTTAPPDAHADYVARYIQRLSEQGPGRSIGVLMRSRAKARTLMFALRSLGVNAAEEGGNPIDNNPAVSAVLSAIWLADHPGDSVCRFHIINTPVSEALGISADDDAVAIAAAARSIRRALIDRGYAPVIADWTRALAPSCDARSLRRLMQLVDLAEQFDQNEKVLRPGMFVEAARAAKVEDASPAPVRVMTIHASKGLEFDSVVLPDLDATLSGHDRNALVVLDRDSPIADVRGVYRRLGKEEAALLPELEHAHEQQAYENRTEDLCLLYVAMTRARQGLHMLVRPLKQAKSGKPTTSGLTNLSYAAVLRQALRASDDEGFEGDERLYELGDAAWLDNDGTQTQVQRDTDAPQATADLIRLAKPTAARRRSWMQTTPSALHDKATVSADDLLRRSDTAGRSYGTAMHALLELVGFADDPPPTDEVCKAALHKLADKPADPDKLIGAMRRALASPAIERLLERGGADGLWRERPFVARVDGALVRGTLDRVHLWTGDAGRAERALLIDYKTDAVDADGLDAAVARYADQLELYRRALSVLTGLDARAIDARLCFVGSGVVAGLNTPTQ